MRIAKIKYPDTANGVGVRVSIFTQGCHRRCPGCFNPETWDEKGGRVFTKEDYDYIDKLLNNWWVKGVSILGGEPFEQVSSLSRLLQKIKKDHPDKTVWVWTGNRFEYVRRYSAMNYIDVLVDGAFIEEQKDISLRFRGSTNQRIHYLTGKDMDE